jgi:hypothetical protein
MFTYSSAKEKMLTTDYPIVSRNVISVYLYKFMIRERWDIALSGDPR